MVNTLKALAVNQQQLVRKRFGTTELIQRLMAEKCEICSSMENIEVHHIRKMSDVQKKGRKPKAEWKILMAARRRKTLVLCRKCHKKLHAGLPCRLKRNKLLESHDARKLARLVRRGDVEKGVILPRQLPTLLF